MPKKLPALRDVPGANIITAAMEATGLSSVELSEVIDVDDRTTRRWSEGPDAPGGRDMPGPARLLVALIAAKPAIVKTLRDLAAGVPIR